MPLTTIMLTAEKRWETLLFHIQIEPKFDALEGGTDVLTPTSAVVAQSRETH